MVKFSVIVPTYNEEKYLKELLLSFNQCPYDDYEIIVSDSQSKDKTREIAKKYGAKVVNGPKKGPSLGRNLGARESKAEYLIFVDADVRVEGGLFEALSNNLDENSAVYLVSIKPSSGKIVDKFIFEVYNFLNPVLIKFIPSLAIYPGYFICIERRVFDKLGGFNASMHLSEDRDLAIRAIEYGPPRFIKKTFVIVSTRRMEEWGWVKFLLFHIYSHLYYTLFKKSVKTKYGEIR